MRVLPQGPGRMQIAQRTGQRLEAFLFELFGQRRKIYRFLGQEGFYPCRQIGDVDVRSVGLFDGIGLAGKVGQI